MCATMQPIIESPGRRTCKVGNEHNGLLYQMGLQTFFEMEDIAVSESVYHVVSSVPDFQTKLADSRPARLALFYLFKNGGSERCK